MTKLLLAYSTSKNISQNIIKIIMKNDTTLNNNK